MRMSEAQRVKTLAMRSLYKEFDDALVSYLRTQAAAQGPADDAVFGLAKKVMLAIDRLPQSLHAQFERRRDVAESFVTVYGPLKPMAPASPETVRRFYEQVCSVGAYAPV